LGELTFGGEVAARRGGEGGAEVDRVFGSAIEADGERWGGHGARSRAGEEDWWLVPQSARCSVGVRAGEPEIDGS
jgi:hypothetical protein